ncbi:tyrosine-type recombinase/integrase [Desulfobacter curvatus]|uniref:tyrosine-type recombinase/integrase n=1 Tax=Desulfobacter curvatus TaxID=2290 RepID=UPI000376B770|nr:site-specific integrase [Desulfobacter curvatus]
MAILQECPVCNLKQAIKNKKCKCGANLIQFKKSQKIKYWIQFRIPDGHTIKDGKRIAKYKQRKEYVGISIEDAKAADGKRKAQKKEGRVFDMLPESTMTFEELTEWYLELPRLKKLAYYNVLKVYLASFNSVFGHRFVKDLKSVDLENYQIQRKDQGKSDSYIDQEIGAARGMVNKAWDNDKVTGDSLKPFKKINKMLKHGSNARDRVLSIEEFNLLIDALPLHARNIFITGFFTGMRMGEILSLKWDQVNLKLRKIELEADQTKDNEKRLVPIPDTLFEYLVKIPRSLQDNHIFLFRGKPLKSIRASLKKACEATGIPYGRNAKNGITPHDLRHTFNTYMRKAGAHDTVTMDITGHSTREMFDRYNTVDEQEKEEAVKRMESMLFSKEGKEKEG